MADKLLPPWLTMSRLRMNYADSTGVSVAEFTGAKVTNGKGGDRLAASLEFTPTGGRTTSGKVERAALIAWLASLKGRQNRTYLFDPSHVRRGSFPATELLSNNTFENGTTGWNSSGGTTISVADRVLRATRNTIGATNLALQPLSALSGLTPNAPYVARYFVAAGRGAYPTGLSIFDSNLNDRISAITTSYGILTGVRVPAGDVMNPGLQDESTSGQLAGDYLQVPYTSLSRCALVDNGPNSFLRSDEFDNAAWAKSGCTATANATTDPFGGSTADRLVEDNSSGTHDFAQAVVVTSAAQDVSVLFFIVPSARGWARILLVENASGTDASAYFNVSAGTLGTVASGANLTNARATITPYGNGWQLCTLTVRKTNAATSINCFIGAATADLLASYTGNSSVAIALWRAGFALSGVPVRPAQTTTAATTGTSPTGSAMHVKGLPASTAGLLLPSDQFEVITSRGSELKIVTAALNSDAAGLGYLQFEPPLRGTVADNAPIIIHNPMGRFIFTGDLAGWDTEPGLITRASAEFEETA